jgi:hypothetical protein
MNLDSMPIQKNPKDGDVVVHQENREGTLVYLLRTVPGTDQFLLSTREEAVAQAVTFAKRQGVRAWLSGHNGDCVPLDTARAVASVRPARARAPRGTPRPGAG